MALRSLAESPDFALPPGAFDVRGWDVMTRVDDEKVGEVDDVLMGENGDPQYLDVDLGLFKRHVLLPLGRARVDEAADVVWVPGMTKDEFAHIPEYTHDLGAITSEYEARLGDAYAGAYVRDEGDRGPAPSAERPLTMQGAAGIGDGRLASLDELDDFEVAHGDPDPRGWAVVASDGKTVGSVSELIIDTSALKVRYLDCDLDEDALGLEDRDRHILIPTGYARLDEDRETVIVDAISSSSIEAMPAFTGLPLEREFEESVRGGFTGDLRGERPAAADTRIRADEVSVEEEEARTPLSEEGRRVEERPEAREELLVRRRPVEGEEQLEADRRSERLEIEPRGRVEHEEEWVDEVERQDWGGDDEAEGRGRER